MFYMGMQSDLRLGKMVKPDIHTFKSKIHPYVYTEKPYIAIFYAHALREKPGIPITHAHSTLTTFT